MDLSKCYEFFNPDSYKGRIHIIGCGAIGSAVAECLARFGIEKMTLWDMDVVEEKNVHNQMYTAREVGMPKTKALMRVLKRINPDIEASLELISDGWKGEILEGIVILAVDSIDLRRKIAETNRYNPNVFAMFDIRNGLTDTQLYFANWRHTDEVEEFLKTMNFRDEDVDEESNVMSACGEVLGVVCTSRLAAAFTSAGVVNFIKGNPVPKLTVTDVFDRNILNFWKK